MTPWTLRACGALLAACGFLWAAAGLVATLLLTLAPPGWGPGAGSARVILTFSFLPPAVVLTVGCWALAARVRGG
jgi:hypothetical protein